MPGTNEDAIRTAAPLQTATDILPPELNLRSILETLEVAFHKLPGADVDMLARAQARLHEQYAAGFRRGQELGIHDGYRNGYDEGFEDGRREALDDQAKEQAEVATLKAAARARRGA